MKKIFAAFSAVLFLISQNAFAQISLLSPWSFQDRLATPAHQIDQSAKFQFGLNGVTPAGNETDADFINFPYHISYGLIDKLEVGAAWGLAMVDRKNRSAQFGITDLMLASRYRFFEANRAERTPGLDLEIGFSFPTASFDKGLGTGALGFIFGWGLVLPLDPVRAHFGLGYRYNLENSDDVRVGATFSYNAGMTLPMKEFYTDYFWRDISLLAELKGFNHARNKLRGNTYGPTPDELYLAPGVNWKIADGFDLNTQVLFGLTTDSSDVGMNIELRF